MAVVHMDPKDLTRLEQWLEISAESRKRIPGVTECALSDLEESDAPDFVERHIPSEAGRHYIEECLQKASSI